MVLAVGSVNFNSARSHLPRPVMIRSLGFRYLLPAANCLSYLALLCFGGNRAIPASSVTPHVEAIPILPRFVIAANVPAVLAAFTTNAIFHLRLKNPFLLSVPFILPLWYLVGCWIDRRIGWSPRKTPIRSRLRDFLLASAVIVAGLAVVVFLQVVKLVRPAPSDPFWFGYGISLWFGFLLVVLAGMVYRRVTDS